MNLTCLLLDLQRASFLEFGDLRVVSQRREHIFGVPINLGHTLGFSRLTKLAEFMLELLQIVRFLMLRNRLHECALRFVLGKIFLKFISFFFR